MGQEWIIKEILDLPRRTAPAQTPSVAEGKFLIEQKIIVMVYQIILKGLFFRPGPV